MNNDELIALALAACNIGESKYAEPGNTCPLLCFDTGYAFDTGHLRQLVGRALTAESRITELQFIWRTADSYDGNPHISFSSMLEHIIACCKTGLKAGKHD